MSSKKSSFLRTNSPLKPKSELPWTQTEAITRIIIYYVLVLALMLTLQLALGGIFLNTFTDPSDPNRIILVANFIASIIGILGILLTYLFLKYDDRKFHQIGWFLPAEVFSFAIIAIGATTLALTVGFIIENFFGIIDFDQMIDGYIKDPFVLASRILFVTIGIAVGEEIMFRGYLQRALDSQLSFWKATTISAFLFGLLHTFLLTSQTQNTLYWMIAVGGSAFVFGYVFSYAYKVTGRNLYFPIIIHGVWDSIIFFFNTEFIYDSFTKVLIEIFSQICAAVVLMAIIWYLSTKTKPKKELEAWN
jgi:membrane protease YdiL (CAAX protease family)